MHSPWYRWKCPVDTWTVLPCPVPSSQYSGRVTWTVDIVRPLPTLVSAETQNRYFCRPQQCWKHSLHSVAFVQLERSGLRCKWLYGFCSRIFAAAIVWHTIALVHRHRLHYSMDGKLQHEWHFPFCRAAISCEEYTCEEESVPRWLQVWWSQRLQEPIASCAVTEGIDREQTEIVKSSNYTGNCGHFYIIRSDLHET